MSTVYSYYSRQGLAALYAFTPFKIIFTSPSVQSVGDATIMTFWYPKGTIGFFCENADVQLLSKPVQKIVSDGKCKHFRELWRVPLREKIGDKIYIYREFPAIRFSSQDKKYVIIINRTFLEYLKGKVSEDKAREAIENSYKRSSFVLAEFSYESVNRPNFCRLGIVLLTHRQSCPLINVCPRRPSRGGSRCPYFVTWSNTKESYAGLYKVVADVKIRLRQFTGSKVKVLKTLLILPYKGKPFLEVLFVDPVNVLAYYNAVNFLPKKFVDRMLRIRFDKTLGIRLYMTSALRIKLSDKALEELLQDLMKNSLAWSWLGFKAGLLAIAKALPEEDKHAPLLPWTRLEHLLCHKISDNARRNSIEKILNGDPTIMRKAMKFIVVHTLAHMIILGLWSHLGLSGDELSYVILPRDESYDIWVFEAASGGYGFLKYLAEHREILYSIISNIFHNVLQPNQCVVPLDANTLSMLRNIVSATIASLRQTSSLPPQDIQRLDSIQHQLEMLIKNIESLYSISNVTPHSYTINRCLAHIIPGRLKEHFNKVIDKFMTTFSEFDGTINYYFIEEGCISGPFTQPFSVSCVIVKPIADGVSQMSLERPLRKPIIEWIETARSSINIITWVLSIDGLSDLIKALKKACSSGAKIRLLLGRGIFSDDNAYNSAINSLKKLFQELGNSIEVRLYDKGQLHAKMIIVDKVVVIQGSLNLTKAALTSNVETAYAVIDPEEVRRYAEDFDKLWNEAIAVKSPEDLKPRQ
jgi:HKD family nuclease